MKITRPKHIIIFAIALMVGLAAAFEATLPYLAERYYRDGFNLIQAQQFQPGIENLKQAVALAPLESQYRVELGRAMEDYAKTLPPAQALKMINDTQKLYVRLLQLDDKNPWYLNRMAVVYSSLATVDTSRQAEYLTIAEKYTRAAAKADQNNPLFQLNLAYFLQSQNRLPEAMDYYQKAIAIDGRISEARFNLAGIYLEQKQTDKALEQYLEILKNSPDMQGVLPSIGRVYLSQNKPEAALPYLEKNAQLFPFDRVGLILLAECYNRLNDLPKATATLDLEVKRFPDDTQSRLNLIKLLRATGQTIEASHQESLLQTFIKSPPK